MSKRAKPTTANVAHGQHSKRRKSAFITADDLIEVLRFQAACWSIAFQLRGRPSVACDPVLHDDCRTIVLHVFDADDNEATASFELAHPVQPDYDLSAYRDAFARKDR